MTEAEIRCKVIETATSYLGCKESDGSHKKIIDLYNSHTPRARGYKVTYTDSWCATFVSAIAVKLGLTDIIPTECSCTKMIGLFKKIKRWEESDAYVPNVGDIIMYDWDDTGKGDATGNPEHVGFVVSVEGRTIKVIEGNIKNAVGYRTIQVNGKNIRGYCLPDYAMKGEDVMVYYKTINDVPKHYKPSIQKLIKDGILKGTGNNEINVSEDFCRIMTVLDRKGLL